MRGSLVGSVWPAIIVAVVGLVLWELIVTVFQIQKFLRPQAVGGRPSPSSSTFPQILDGLRKTGYVAVTGLVAGVVIAVVMALLCTQVPRLSPPR